MRLKLLILFAILGFGTLKAQDEVGLYEIVSYMYIKNDEVVSEGFPKSSKSHLVIKDNFSAIGITLDDIMINTYAKIEIIDKKDDMLIFSGTCIHDMIKTKGSFQIKNGQVKAVIITRGSGGFDVFKLGGKL